MARRMADERLVTGVLEHLLLARAAATEGVAPRQSSQLLAAVPAAFESHGRLQAPCEAPERRDELWWTGGSTAPRAHDPMNVPVSEATRAAARRVAQLRAAQAVRRRLLLTAAGSAVRTAGHVKAGGTQPRPSRWVAPVEAARGSAMREQSGMAAIPYRMPECPPSRPGRRRSVWAPAHADHAPP